MCACTVILLLLCRVRVCVPIGRTAGRTCVQRNNFRTGFGQVIAKSAREFGNGGRRTRVRECTHK